MKLGTRVWMLPALLLVFAGCPGEDGSGEGTGESQIEDVGGARQLSVTRIGDAKAPGSTIVYEVRVDGGPTPVDAFGLDVSFDPAELRYVGYERGDLTATFTQLAANGIAEDRVRVGGFTVEGAVPAGAVGSLAVLEFEVVSDAPGLLGVVNPLDDIAGFSQASR